MTAGTTMPPKAAMAGKGTGRRGRRPPAQGPRLFFLPPPKKEQGHEHVVDDVNQVLLEPISAHIEADGAGPERLVAGAPRRVRPHEGRSGRHDEEDPARRLDVQEPHEGLRGPGESTVTVEEGRGRAREWGWRHRAPQRVDED